MLHAERSVTFNVKGGDYSVGNANERARGPHFALHPLLMESIEFFPVNTEHPWRKLHASLRDYQYGGVIALHLRITRRSLLCIQ